MWDRSRTGDGLALGGSVSCRGFGCLGRCHVLIRRSLWVSLGLAQGHQFRLDETETFDVSSDHEVARGQSRLLGNEPVGFEQKLM